MLEGAGKMCSCATIAIGDVLRMVNGHMLTFCLC